MRKNFEATGVAILKFGDSEVDLHNDLLLDRINVNSADANLDLIWSSDKLVSRKLYISFKGVSRYIISKFEDREIGDDYRTLDFVGYLPHEEFGKSFEFLMEKDFQNGYHMIFGFVDDSFISVEADECWVGYSDNVVKIN